MNQISFLIPMHRLGYNIDEEGMCFGYEHMAAQAIFAGEFPVFMERIHAIENTSNAHLVNEISNIKDKPAEDAQKYVDMRAFFDGIALYQKNSYPEIYPEGQAPTFQADIKQTTAVLSPVKFDEAGAQMNAMGGFSGVYNKDEIKDYLRSLQETAANMSLSGDAPTPLVFELIAQNHGTCLSYDPHNTEHPWIFIDPNFPDDVYHASIDDVAEKIHRAFDGEENTILATSMLYTTKQNEVYEGSYKALADSFLAQWKEHPAWKNIHTVSDEKLNARDEDDLSWLEYEFTRTKEMKNIESLLEHASPEEVHQAMSDALAAGNEPVVDFLFKEKNIDVHWISDDAFSFLHFAANAIDPASAKSLTERFLQQGLDADEINLDDEHALFYAARRGHNEVIDLLIEAGANPRQPNSNGDSISFVAAENGKASTVEKLMNMGFDVNQKNWAGTSPLLAAAKNHHLDVVNLLVEHGANVNEVDEKGDSVLFHALCGAIEKGDLQAVNALISHGADPYDLRKSENEQLRIRGENLLPLVIEQNNEEVMGALVLLGVKVDEKHIAACKTDDMKAMAIQGCLKNKYDVPFNPGLLNMATQAFNLSESAKETAGKLMQVDNALAKEIKQNAGSLMDAIKNLHSTQNSAALDRVVDACSQLFENIASLKEKSPSLDDKTNKLLDQYMQGIEQIRQEAIAVRENNRDYSVEGMRDFMFDMVRAAYGEHRNLMALAEQPESAAFQASQARLNEMREDIHDYMQQCFEPHAHEMEELMQYIAQNDPAFYVVLYVATGLESMKEDVALGFVDVNEPSCIKAKREGNLESLSICPLHLAVTLNNHEAVDLFVTLKADVNLINDYITTDKGWFATPLSMAVACQNEKTVKTLADAGAHVSEEVDQAHDADEVDEPDQQASVSLSR